MIAVVDLGTGNLFSVTRALSEVGGDAVICSEPSGLVDAAAIVLPGVGAFREAMDTLRGAGWVDALEREVQSNGKPFLGICLGMQLVARRSTEFGDHAGLGWVDAVVHRLPKLGREHRIPHIGWNDVRFREPAEGMSRDLAAEECFYFVHSYGIEPDGKPFEKATADHGVPFVACIEQDNVWACQFHPEKSQRAGLGLLENFVRRAA